jgi:hypothetical protein
LKDKSLSDRNVHQSYRMVYLDKKFIHTSGIMADRCYEVATEV